MNQAQQEHATKQGNIITMKDDWKPNCKQIIIEEVKQLGDGLYVKHVWGKLFYNSMTQYVDAIDWKTMEELGVFSS